MSRPVATNRVLNQFVDRAKALHTLPSVAVRILELTNDPQIDLRQVKECIEQDPALTVKILRTVNSSMFGLSREVSDLNQAIALLGTTPLKMLVLGFSLPANLFDGVEQETLTAYWQHTLIKAVSARTLAQQVFKEGGDEAYISGLLQGLGQLVLIQELDTAYTKFLDRVSGDRVSLAELETHTLGFDHASLSSHLLDHWGFPARLVRAIGRPFDTEQLSELPLGERELPQVLHLSDLISQFLVCGTADLLKQVMETGAAYSHWSEEVLRKIIKELAVQVPQLADAYSQHIDIEFEEVLEAAYSQLSEISQQAVVEMISSAGNSEQQMDQFASSHQDDMAALETAVERSVSAVANIASGAAASAPAPAPASATAAVPVSSAPGAAVAERSSPALIVGFDEQLAVAIKRCRQSRIPLSLLLIEVANAEEQIFQLGPQGFESLMTDLQGAIRSLGEVDGVVRCGEARFAVMLPEFERSEAVLTARTVVQGVLSGLRAMSRAEMPLAGGVATLSCPPANFPAAEMIVAAERCLYGAHQCGGGAVKSIDL